MTSFKKQIIHSTAKEWFEKSEGKLKLFGVNFSMDQQISFWVNRAEETWKKISNPISVEGFMDINHSKNSFNL